MDRPRSSPRDAVRRAALTVMAAAGLLAALSTPAAAAPGDLDPSFAGGGSLVVGTPGVFDLTNAVAVQPDGKVVVAGMISQGDGSDMFVARFEPDGTPDAGFGDGGRRTIDVAGFEDGARAIALQPDGKIVLAGYGSSVSGLNQSDYAVVRVTADGALDSSFGDDGVRTIDFGLGAEQAYAVVVQPDGKLVVGGYANPSSGVIDFGLARLTADGALDSSFGDGGKRTTEFPGAGSNIHALVLDDAGRIIAAGRTNGSNADFALARYLPNGTLDGSFGDDGLVTTDFGSPMQIDDAYGVALQPDGKIVASGYTGGDISDNRFAVARYDDDGTLDDGFGNGGLQTIPFSPTAAGAQYPSAYGYGGIAIQRDGSLVIAGVSEWYDESFEPRSNFALAGLTPAGQLNAGFAPGGTVTTAFPAPQAQANAIAIDPRTGALVVAGDAYGDGEAGTAIARYLGTPPPTRMLTVGLTGDGAGSVHGDGIDCPGDCSEGHHQGDTATLTATADAGSHFTGWSGACSGIGACTVTLAVADVTVTAAFAADPVPPPPDPPSGPPSGGSAPPPKPPAAKPTVACTRATRTLSTAQRALRSARARTTRAAATLRRRRVATARARRTLARAVRDGDPVARAHARKALQIATRRQRAATRTLTSARKAQHSAEQRRRDAARAVAKRC